MSSSRLRWPRANRQVLLLILGLAVVVAGLLGAERPNEPPYFAIRGARIMPVSGPAIEEGTIVMAKGVITAVGAKVTIPPEAWVIEGKGLTVYPGLIDSLTNLGLQTVYQLFNAHEEVVCERVFLPPKQELQAQLASGAPLRTLESQTPVADFDVFAFSVSFEWDYTNLVAMLRLARLPIYAADRTNRHPLVVLGGAVTFVNPEPLAPFVDVVAAGEGEALVPALIEVLGSASNREIGRAHV